MTINGALAVTSKITSAACCLLHPNHITNKQYVDDAIAAAITPPQVFDYDVTNSTNTDTVYYINGDLLMYATMESLRQLHHHGVRFRPSAMLPVLALRARGNVRLDLYRLLNQLSGLQLADVSLCDVQDWLLRHFNAQLGDKQTDTFSHLVSFTTAAGDVQYGLDHPILLG